MRGLRKVVLAGVVACVLVIPVAIPTHANQNGTNQNGNPQQYCQNGTIVNGVCMTKQNSK